MTSQEVSKVQKELSQSQQIDLFSIGTPPSWISDYFPEIRVKKDLDFISEKSLDNPVVVIVCSPEHLEISNQLTLFQHCSFFVLGEHWTVSQLENLFSKSGFCGALTPTSQIESLKMIQNELIEQQNRSQSRFRKRLFSQELKHLEMLNQELESIVEERTQFFEESKAEEDSRLVQTRGIVKSIQDLAQLQDFEEILSFLKKELRIFHGIGEILFLEWSPGSGDLASLATVKWLAKDQLQSVGIKLKLNGIKNREINNISSGELSPLAQLFQRPFGAGLLLTLDSKKKRFILFESFISENDLPAVYQFLSDRVLPVSLTFDRIHIEKEILNSISRWEESFDSIQDALAIVSHSYEVARSNKAFEKFKGTKCYEILLNRTSPCDDCPLQKKTKTTKMISDGKKVFELSSNPLIIDDLPQVNYYSIHLYSDRTESRELSARVFQSEKMAALGELSAHIAHELNNPLTGIRSMTQILLNDKNISSSTREDLKQIESGAERAQKIIDNLMQFTKGETGHRVLLSANGVVESTLPFIKTALRDHKYHVLLNSKDSMFLAELPLMQQVLFNLVNNASQAMEKSGELWIEAGEFESQEVKYSFIDVKDSGPGIPLDLREKIFEPLFTTKPEGAGTGLGLALSKKIVESFGGKISVLDSQKGAHFRVWFPVKVKND